MQYPVSFENRTIGQMQVRKNGLYYQFTCQCTPPDRNIYRIVIFDGNAEQSLGVCVPEGDHFVLFKKLPVKNIKDGEWEFYLCPKDAGKGVVAVSEETPFPQLEKLEYSSLVVENGQPFITIREEG